MTTQKITSTLNKSGFKAFRVYSEKINGVYTNVRTGHFKAFKCGKMIGIETYGIQTQEQIQVLLNAGINTQETVRGSGMMKISN